jgi:hypothetical protein
MFARIALLLVLCVSLEGFGAASRQSIQVLAETQPFVVGHADLPEGTQMRTTLTCGPSGYRAERVSTVRGGRFEAGPFSDAGAPLKPSTCTAVVEEAQARGHERGSTTRTWTQVSVTFTVPGMVAPQQSAVTSLDVALPAAAPSAASPTAGSGSCPCGSNIYCVDVRRGRYCMRAGNRTYE